MSYLFIVNPVAGKNKGAKAVPFIHKIMEEKGVAYKIIQTTKKGDAKGIATEAVNQGYSTIVAVGGDGTVQEVLNGIVGSSATLGIIPSGTGNDFSRALHLPEDLHEALEIIFQGKTQKIDLGKTNGLYFMNFASVGLDAAIAFEANRIKEYVSSKLAYVMAAIKEIATFQSRKIEFLIDNQKMSADVMMITVCNGNYYGGGMKVAPKASLKDGFFDVYVIKKINKLKLLFLFPTIFSGKHVKYKEVSFYRAKKVKITSENQLKVNADGELINSNSLEFEILQQQLEVITNSSAVEERKRSYSL